MNKKYELTDETCKVAGKTLYRIRALRDIDLFGVNTGDLGGFVEDTYNLSQDGDAWVFDAAQVFDDAQVFDNAEVYGDALVFEDAHVFDDACVFGDAYVYGNARVSGNAYVDGNTVIDS